MLPNVFIAGFPKAATSSVHRWLADHPDAGGSRPKETEYFIDRGWSSFHADANYQDHGLDRYDSYFAYLGESRPQVVFESSVEYVYQKVALETLPGLATRPRFVFVLREPAAQMYSLFQYLRNNQGEIPPQVTFRQYLELLNQASPLLDKNSLLIEPLANCRYAAHLEAWASRCGRDRIFVYLFEDLREDPCTFMQNLATDLGLDPGFYASYGFPSENESYSVRAFWMHRLSIVVRNRLSRGPVFAGLRALYRKLNTARPSITNEDAQLREDLKERFRDDNRRLAEQFDLDLSAWE